MPVADAHAPTARRWRCRVLVVRGARARGKRCSATAGVHGDEFEGMARPAAACTRNCGPRRCAGTFVAVPVANPPAYEAALPPTRRPPGHGPRLPRRRARHGDGAAGRAPEQRGSRARRFLLRPAQRRAVLPMPPLVGYQLRPERC